MSANDVKVTQSTVQGAAARRCFKAKIAGGCTDEDLVLMELREPQLLFLVIFSGLGQ